MKILDARKYLLSDERFTHVATVREGLRDYICFSESPLFFCRRKVLKPFPPKPQVYVEEIKPLNANSFTLNTIDDDEIWRAVVGLLIIEGIVDQTDLLEGYENCVAVFNRRMLRNLCNTEK